MATIIVAAVGAGLTQGLTGTALIAATAAVAAATMGAAYIDARYVYPALFPEDSPQQPILAGIDQMTGDDGAPGHTCWGRMAMVGGHVLFFENQADIVNTQTQKKGPSVTTTKRIADIGVGLCRNLIAGVDQIFADQKVFWRRDPNNVLWADYRATITTAAGTPTRLRIEPTVADVSEFTPILAAGDVVRVAGMVTSPNGLWRVADATGMGTGAHGFGLLDLTALEGQTPVAGTAGTAASPLEVRRMDAVIAEDIGTSTFVRATSSTSQIVIDVVFAPTPGQPQIGLPQPGISRSHFWRRPDSIFRVGVEIRVTGCTPTTRNGRWKIFGVQEAQGSPGVYVIIRLFANALDGQVSTAGGTTYGTETQPARIELIGEEGFLDPVAEQALQIYLGTEDQGPDPDLAALFGVTNVHGYRGRARVTIRKLVLSNWGDRAPSFSAAVTASPGHTTRDVIRDLMREAFRGDDSRYDLSKLEPNALLGYTRRGLQTTSQALQPLAIAYGIEAQDQGGTWVFFKPAAADLHQLGEDDFGAYVGRENRPPRSFAHKRLQTRDLPRRLFFYYRDPINSFTRTGKLVRVDLPEDPSAEDVAVDVDPLVLYPWDAQDAGHRIYAQYVVGRDQGPIVVPPSRIDILPNDRVTFTALQWNEEVCAGLETGEIDHTTRIAGIEPGSISIEVEFTNAGNCRLVDDGEGALVGLPDTVGVTINEIDYNAGTVHLMTVDLILGAIIRYEFPNPWRMRVQRRVRQAHGLTLLELVAVAEKFPVVGSPTQYNEPLFQPAIRAAALSAHVLDIPGVFPSTVERPGIFYAACAKQGATWRGAGVYSSIDGVSYTLRAVIDRQTPIGTAFDALASGDFGVVDWVNTVDVLLDYGELTDATLEQVSSGLGTNWILIGNEVLAFLQAELIGGSDLETDPIRYRLSGLVRGLRDTVAHIGTHVAKERVVSLDGLGVPGFGFAGGYYEEFLTTGDIGQQRYWKIAPAGGALDDVDAVVLTPQANNVRPFAPGDVLQGDIITNDYDAPLGSPTYNPAAWNTQDIVIRWFRRTRSTTPVFGAGSTAPLMEAIERYEVRIFKNGVELTHRARIIGGINSGSPFAHRVFRYTLAEQQADGWPSGAIAVILVRQIGVGGAFGYSPDNGIAWTVP